MGGGDLNLKKSWHPNTMKNQERVWKAEQAKQEEQRKLDDLRKEIHEERDREELRRIGENSGVLNSNGGEAKLEWMYKNSAELINREEYLLGRKIDKSFEQLQAEEKLQEQSALGVKQSINHVEHDCVPFSIREYRNLKSTEQVDMQRKTMEDPLMLIKQREMESRRKLLENPVKLKEIHRLLKTEQKHATKRSKKEKKSKKKKYRKDLKEYYSDGSDSNDDLDKRLARQMKKLKREGTHDDFKLDKLLDAKYRTLTKQLDLATKKKKKNKKKSKHRNSDSSEDSESGREESVKRSKRRRERRGRSNSTSGEETKDRRERSISSSLERNNRKKRGHKKKHRDVSKSSEDDWSPGGRNCEHSRNSSSPDRRSRKGRVMKRKHRDESCSSPDERTKRKKRRDRSNSSSADRKKRKEREHDRKQRKSRSCSSRDKSPNRKDPLNGGKKRRYSSSPDRKEHMERKNDRKHRSPERSGQRHPTQPVPRSSPQVTKTPATSKPKLSETEREERLREMMENAMWREADRTMAVHKHREEYEREEAQNQARDFDKQFINKEVKKAIDNQTSIGNRIRSNLNNIQRTSDAMDANFARK